MGRLDRRIRRLEQQVRGRYATPWQARVARMSYEELQAEMVRMAAERGYPGNTDSADMGAVLQWLHEEALASIDNLPEDDQSEWRAQLQKLGALATGPW